MKTLIHTIILSLLLSAPAFAGPVNINTADAATIAMELKGVGEKTAAAIVAYREEHGPFKTLDELRNVKGIGDKIIANNEPDILFAD